MEAIWHGRTGAHANQESQEVGGEGGGCDLPAGAEEDTSLLCHVVQILPSAARELFADDLADNDVVKLVVPGGRNRLAVRRENDEATQGTQRRRRDEEKEIKVMTEGNEAKDMKKRT